MAAYQASDPPGRLGLPASAGLRVSYCSIALYLEAEFEFCCFRFVAVFRQFVATVLPKLAT